jgi:hypothetical protein
MVTHFRHFGRVVPRALRPRLRRLRHAVEGINRSASHYVPLDPGLRARLTERFEEDTAYVERLTRPLPMRRGTR